MTSTPKGFKQSRLYFINLGPDGPEFPELPLCGYLVDWLLAVGPDYQNGMGTVAVPQAEIQAWAKNTNLTMHKTEADWLSLMSRAYVAEFNRSNDKETPQPFIQNKDTGT